MCSATAAANQFKITIQSNRLELAALEVAVSFTKPIWNHLQSPMYRLFKVLKSALSFYIVLQREFFFAWKKKKKKRSRRRIQLLSGRGSSFGDCFTALLSPLQTPILAACAEFSPLAGEYICLFHKEKKHCQNYRFAGLKGEGEARFHWKFPTQKDNLRRCSMQFIRNIFGTSIKRKASQVSY